MDGRTDVDVDLDELNGRTHKITPERASKWRVSIKIRLRNRALLSDPYSPTQRTQGWKNFQATSIDTGLKINNVELKRAATSHVYFKDDDSSRLRLLRFLQPRRTRN